MTLCYAGVYRNSVCRCHLSSLSKNISIVSGFYGRPSPQRCLFTRLLRRRDVKRDSPRVLAFLPAHSHTPHTTDTIKITKIMLKLETQGALRRNLRVSIPQFSQQSAQPVLRFFNANEPRMQTRRTRSSFSGGRQ
jgi:hypothetical protein